MSAATTMAFASVKVDTARATDPMAIDMRGMKYWRAAGLERVMKLGCGMEFMALMKDRGRMAKGRRCRMPNRRDPMPNRCGMVRR